MNQAINAYYTITASPKFRELERLREKARHDEAQALHHARAEGRAEGIAKGRAEGIAEGRAEGIAEGRAEGRAEGIAEGRTEGIAKGRAEGIAKGRAEGISDRNIEIAQTMLADGEPTGKILRYTGLTTEQLDEIRP